MTPREAHDEVAALFLASFEPNGIPILWDGVKIEPPSDGGEFVRFTFLHDEGEGAAFGGESFDNRGSVIVQCFAPLGKGPGRALEIANLALECFAGKHTDGGLWFFRPTPRTVGADRLWYQVNATVAFEYRQTRGVTKRPKDGDALAALMGRELAPTSYWRFDEGGADEPAFAIDLAGGGVHLAPAGNPRPTQGVFVPALESKTVLTATGKTMQADDSGNLQGGTGSVAALWIGRVNSLPASGTAPLLGKSAAAGYALNVNASGRVLWELDDGTTETRGFGVVDVDQAIGVLGVYDEVAGTATVYVWSRGVVTTGNFIGSTVLAGSLDNAAIFTIGAADANHADAAVFLGTAAEGLTGTHLSNLMTALKL